MNKLWWRWAMAFSLAGILSLVLWPITDTDGEKPDAVSLDDKRSHKPSSVISPGQVSRIVQNPKQRTAGIRTITPEKHTTDEATDIDYRFDEAKIASMQEARLHGDPRTPPIKRSMHVRVKPTPEELADPDLYLEYEARSTHQVYANYVQAVKKRVAYLEAFLIQAEAGGVSDAQLAEGYEKIAKLKAMSDRLQAENNLPEHNIPEEDLSTFDVP